MKLSILIAGACFAFAGCERLNGGPAPVRATPAPTAGTGGSGAAGQEGENEAQQLVTPQQLLQSKNALGASNGSLAR